MSDCPKCKRMMSAVFFSMACDHCDFPNAAQSGSKTYKLFGITILPTGIGSHEASGCVFPEMDDAVKWRRYLGDRFVLIVARRMAEERFEPPWEPASHPALPGAVFSRCRVYATEVGAKSAPQSHLPTFIVERNEG